MPSILHILTRPEDQLASTIIQQQEQDAHGQVTVIDLTKPEADYAALLEKIFASDSVQVW